MIHVCEALPDDFELHIHFVINCLYTKKCYTIVNDMTRNACQLVGVGRGLQSNNIIRWI